VAAREATTAADREAAADGIGEGWVAAGEGLPASKVRGALTASAVGVV
jgi:hypothetical protein